FLFYLLKLKENKIIGNSGAVFPSINKSQIEQIEILFPSLSEQKAIVKKLDELSEKTKRLEEIYKLKLANLEELKKSILKKAFNGEL
ncbi:MAG: restriction endonuclease subunit S, partial [bacterium]|nr:restriction endonuclease subunit S [bacterium]